MNFKIISYLLAIASAQSNSTVATESSSVATSGPWFANSTTTSASPSKSVSSISSASGSVAPTRGFSSYSSGAPGPTAPGTIAPPSNPSSLPKCNGDVSGAGFDVNIWRFDGSFNDLIPGFYVSEYTHWGFIGSDVAQSISSYSHSDLPASYTLEFTSYFFATVSGTYNFQISGGSYSSIQIGGDCKGSYFPYKVPGYNKRADGSNEVYLTPGYYPIRVLYVHVESDSSKFSVTVAAFDTTKELTGSLLDNATSVDSGATLTTTGEPITKTITSCDDDKCDVITTTVCDEPTSSSAKHTYTKTITSCDDDKCDYVTVTVCDEPTSTPAPKYTVTVIDCSEECEVVHTEMQTVTLPCDYATTYTTNTVYECEGTTYSGPHVVEGTPSTTKANPTVKGEASSNAPAASAKTSVVVSEITTSAKQAATTSGKIAGVASSASSSKANNNNNPSLQPLASGSSSGVGLANGASKKGFSALAGVAIMLGLLI